jgi:purine-binding chemotaxis protein CheW
MTSSLRSYIARNAKYTTFALGREECGVEAYKVQELLAFSGVSSLRRVPPWILGVVDMHGRKVPVVDLQMKAGLGVTRQSPEAVIIVVQQLASSGFPWNVGILADGVLGVTHFSTGQIVPLPAHDTSAVRAVANTERGSVLLLDVDQILTAAEAFAIATAMS